MSRCVFDTDVVIAALDRSDAHHHNAVHAIKAMRESGDELFLSAVNYAEALVRPAEHDVTMRAAVDSIAAIGLKPVAPGAAIAREAARLRGLGISLADGFALATAVARTASVASFDLRVRRALAGAGLELAPGFG